MRARRNSEESSQITVSRWWERAASRRRQALQTHPDIGSYYLLDPSSMPSRRVAHGDLETSLRLLRTLRRLRTLRTFPLTPLPGAGAQPADNAPAVLGPGRRSLALRLQIQSECRPRRNQPRRP